MAEMLSAAGTAATDMMGAASGAVGSLMNGGGMPPTSNQTGVGPLMGNMVPAPIKSLLDEIANKNDPTKDPYKPNQPIVYGPDGGLTQPESKYAGLISMMTGPGAPVEPPSLPPIQIPRTAPNPQPTASKLARQAYGSYF